MFVCPICSSENLSTLYYGVLRTGTFGKSTSKKSYVYECQECSVKFIKNQLDESYYKSVDYREDYNNSLDIQSVYEEHDQIDANKLYTIGLENLRHKKIADFGAAAGSFLQLVANVSEFSVAIEPSQHFHEVLERHNKYVFSYGSDLVKSGIKIDVATSFDVIEHTQNPVTYAKEIYDSLHDNGKLYLKTPNFYDILHELNAEVFDPFNYRTAHLFYFDEDSLVNVLKRAGFSQIKVKYLHDYDVSNLLGWMKESKPTGLNKIKTFDNGFNIMYKNYLEQNALASHLWIEATK